MTTKDLGEIGEQAAADFLIQQGCTILDRNWQYGHNEIDIIALDGQFLIIAEVKLRDYNSAVSPISAVNSQKQRNLIAAANGYIKIKQRTEEIRMDVISIIHHNTEIISIEHIKNAFYPFLRST